MPKAKPTVKRASRASATRKTTAKRTTKATKAKAPAKASTKTGAKAKPAAKPTTGKSASRLIDQRIRDVGGWRGETLADVRRMIHEAEPDIVEECKWVKPTNPGGVPVWSHDGIVCTGEVYAKAVKLTFARGAAIPDPSHLFNSSLDGNTRRAIDIHEGEKLNARAFKTLVKSAVAANGAAKNR